MRAPTPQHRPEAVLPRLRARLADEAGVSLILILGFMLIFSISTAAIVNELVLNQSAAAREQKMVTALGAAEAELAYAQQWVQRNDADASKPDGSYYPSSGNTPVSLLAASDKSSDATYSYKDTYYYTGNTVPGATDAGWWAHKYPESTCVTLNDSAAGFDCWVVEGRATVGTSTREVQAILNGNVVETNATTVTKTATTTNTVTQLGTTTNTTSVTTQTTATDYGSWGFGTYSSGLATSSCYTISGNGAISEPVYTPGNLCMTGNAAITQNAAKSVTLYVKGTLSTSSNSYAGTSTNKLVSATVGSCSNGGAVICSSGSSSHLWAAVYYSSGGAINKPTVNLDSVYASADPGPKHPCSVAAGSTASSTWPTFDTNTTRDDSIGSTTSPFTSSAYTCKTDTGGSISWNPGTRVFTVTGTVFIDGDLSFSNVTVIYQGRGNIYYDGTIAMSGNGTVYICPAASCPTDGSWNMGVNLLLIAAGNKGVIPTTCGYSWSMAGNAIFQGAAWANGCVQESGNGGIEGPAVADGYSISGNGTYYQPLGTNTLPPGAPVNTVTTSVNTVTIATSTYTNTGTFTNTSTNTNTVVTPFWGLLRTSWRQLK